MRGKRPWVEAVHRRMPVYRPPRVVDPHLSRVLDSHLLRVVWSLSPRMARIKLQRDVEPGAQRSILYQHTLWIISSGQ